MRTRPLLPYRTLGPNYVQFVIMMVTHYLPGGRVTEPLIMVLLITLSRSAILLLLTVYRDHKVLNFSWSLPNEEFSSYRTLQKHIPFKCPDNMTKSDFCEALEQAWQTQPQLPPANFTTQNDCDRSWKFAMANVQNMFATVCRARSPVIPKNSDIKPILMLPTLISTLKVVF